jgi:hypothetical protein
MKRKIAAVLLIIAVGFAIFFVIGLFQPSRPVKVTSTNILRVTPGMPLEEVFNILGRPYGISCLHGIHNIGCVSPNPRLDQAVNQTTDVRKLVRSFIESQKSCCEGNKRELAEFNNITLVYTERGLFFSYPMLWVHLDTSFRVKDVYAKEYEGGFFGDDPGIYGFGWATDSTGIKLDYTRTEKWMNEEKFYRCFQ